MFISVAQLPVSFPLWYPPARFGVVRAVAGLTYITEFVFVSQHSNIAPFSTFTPSHPPPPPSPSLLRLDTTVPDIRLVNADHTLACPHSIPANTKRSANVDLKGQRRRRWTNSKSTLGQRLVFAAKQQAKPHPNYNQHPSQTQCWIRADQILICTLTTFSIKMTLEGWK